MGRYLVFGIGKFVFLEVLLVHLFVPVVILSFRLSFIIRKGTSSG